jgi:hypothetical protein
MGGVVEPLRRNLAWFITKQQPGICEPSEIAKTRPEMTVSFFLRLGRRGCPPTPFLIAATALELAAPVIKLNDRKDGLDRRDIRNANQIGFARSRCVSPAFGPAIRVRREAEITVAAILVREWHG